jgi:hypothetical protein
VTAVYARPKFSKKMLQNISLPIKNYIKQIQKKSKKYDPKDFAMLEEEMKNFHLMGNGSAKELSSKIKTDKKFLGKGAGSDFGDMKPGKLKEKIFPGGPAKNKNLKKPAKSQKHNNGNGGGNNPFGGQGQQGFPGMGQQPIQIICPQQNNFIYADNIMQQQIIIQNNQNIMFNQYPGYFIPNYGNQQIMLNQNQNFFPFNNNNTNNIGINTNNIGINTNNIGINTNNIGINTNNIGINTNNTIINTNNSQTQTPMPPNTHGQPLDLNNSLPPNGFLQNPHMQGFNAGSQFASTNIPQFTTTQTQQVKTETRVFSSGTEELIPLITTTKVAIEDATDDYHQLGIFDSSIKKKVATETAEFESDDLFGFKSNIPLGEGDEETVCAMEPEYNMFEGLDDFAKKNSISGVGADIGGQTAVDSASAKEDLENKLLSGSKLSSKKGYSMYGSMPKFEGPDEMEAEAENQVTIDKNILSIFTD